MSRNPIIEVVGRLALYAVAHFVEAVAAVKFGVDNTCKGTILGDVAAAYDGVYMAAAGAAAFTQFYLAAKLGTVEPRPEAPVETSPVAEGNTPTPLAEQMDAVIVPTAVAAEDAAAQPSVRSRALTIAAHVLCAATGVL